MIGHSFTTFSGRRSLMLSDMRLPLDATGNHFWSICAEEQFYLVAPFLITFVVSRGHKQIWLWATIALVSLASPFWDYFAAISLGVLAAAIKEKYGSVVILRSAFVVLAIVAFAFTVFDIASYRIAAPISAILIVLALAGEKSQHFSGQILGGVSYPLYLNQWIGVFAANALFAKFGMRETLLCQITGVVLAILIAFALYMLIDRNVLRHRNKFFTRQIGLMAGISGFCFFLLDLLAVFCLLMGEVRMLRLLFKQRSSGRRNKLKGIPNGPGFSCV